jgi:phage baseplate assembly protein W
LRLILLTELKSLFGDPGYGCGLKKFLFEQNSPIVRDLIVDKIYNTIRTYIPQLVCKRTDINISKDKVNIYIDLTAMNLIDYTVNNYSIALMNF